MTWRDQYRLHPAADVFPMMSDEELQSLGEDIKKNGLKHQIVFQQGSLKGGKLTLLDGRNRLEAMERAGIQTWIEKQYRDGDPVAHIIGLNIRRRHLTKAQQANLIIAAHKAAENKPRQVGEVSSVSSRSASGPTERPPRSPGSPGGRGKVNTFKAAVLADAEKHGIGKRTVERSIAKAEGRLPEPSRITGPKLSSKPKDMQRHVGIDAARRYYLERCAEPDIDLDAERGLILDAFQELAGKRAMAAAARPASALDYPDLPDFLDRRQR
jgi:hypothetical protein